MGDDHRTAPPPSADDFTGPLRALLAEEQANHTPDTERIRARLLAAGVPATPVGGLASRSAPATSRSGITVPVGTAPDDATRGLRALRRRRSTGRRPQRARMPLLVGASTAVLAALFLLNGMLSGGGTDLGTVTAASQPATARSPEPPDISLRPDGPAPAPAPGQADGSSSPSQSPPGPTAGTGTADSPPPPGTRADPGPSGAPGSSGPNSQGGPPAASGPDAGAERGDGSGSGRGEPGGHDWARDHDGRGSGNEPENGPRDRRYGDRDGQGPAAVSPDRGDGRHETGPSSASARPFGRADQINLPTAGCLDWVLFDEGGVQTRAAAPRARIGTSRISAGAGAGGFSNPFSWTGGQPVASGSRDNDRLITSRVGLEVDRTSEPRRLDVYLGSSAGSVTVVVGEGRDAAFHRVALSGRHGAADAVVSVQLPRADGPTSVTIVGSGPLTLAAVVLY
ncbi:ICP22 family protein [Parafrankia elaeagni]|uniref:hypothetical protein n=1 Tax=Parafrankia elaeagni TaxID=222534 RepID=UPI0003A9FC91|nr:hypothetical protein [Parafrankia elaeagni]